jgi:hypothetical protein
MNYNIIALHEHIERKENSEIITLFSILGEVHLKTCNEIVVFMNDDIRLDNLKRKIRYVLDEGEVDFVMEMGQGFLVEYEDHICRISLVENIHRERYKKDEEIAIFEV